MSTQPRTRLASAPPPRFNLNDSLQTLQNSALTQNSALRPPRATHAKLCQSAPNCTLFRYLAKRTHPAHPADPPILPTPSDLLPAAPDAPPNARQNVPNHANPFPPKEKKQNEPTTNHRRNNDRAGRDNHAGAHHQPPQRKEKIATDNAQIYTDKKNAIARSLICETLCFIRGNNSFFLTWRIA